MNDLENRLRDALDAAAGTIPDSAIAPGLVTHLRVDRSGRRPTWIIAVAAALAVVVAVAVPFVARRDRTGPAISTCPGGITATPDMPLDRPVSYRSPVTEDETRRMVDSLPVGGPPRVPYTVNAETGAGYLQDGKTRTPLATGKNVHIFERLHCSWLVARTEMRADGPGDSEFGVLQASGQFLRLGGSTRKPLSGSRLSVGMSPDGTKVAYTATTAGKQTRLAVVEIASRKETASTLVEADTEVIAWNPSGVWLRYGYQLRGRHSHAVWQPGSAPRQVKVAGSGLLYAYRTTDRMFVSRLPQQGNRHCADIVRLTESGALTKLTESCVESEYSHPSLSPDGRIVVLGDKARGVADGRETQLPKGYVATSHVWEDNNSVLLVGTALGFAAVRCNVETGRCERVYTSSSDLPPRLIEQDPHRLTGYY